ncbi:hypothetical protein [Actinoplanes auranticolor]|uniref:Uncharacterized protein n=1 Tax=Actinoplanes auranticolor TaxID=47988 RepID=A0A919VPR1_9ACTN|nr:hypothetical protein [Actinoplanes auranticolor]GIM64400.1 hypothetical protein Aau02nite_10130 [Actinoplanes auranticolor]
MEHSGAGRPTRLTACVAALTAPALLAAGPVAAAIPAAETVGVHGELLAEHFSSVTPGNRPNATRCTPW